MPNYGDAHLSTFHFMSHTALIFSEFAKRRKIGIDSFDLIKLMIVVGSDMMTQLSRVHVLF